MRGIEKRHTFRRWFYSPLTVIILLAVTILVWRGVWGVYQKETRSRARVEELRAKKERLIERKAELEERVSDLQTDKGVTKEIREKFDVVAEGEQVVVLVDSDASTTTPETKEENIVQRMWAAIVGFF